MTTASVWLDRIRELPLPPRIKVMNVCGGHERSITMAGLRKALPTNIELVPGPGCPVCICPEEDIYEAIQLALHEGVILVAYGDMLRVPVNAPKSEPRSLEQAKAAGNLESGKEQTVTVTANNDITIEPTDPQTVYVPQYSPAVYEAAPAQPAEAAENLQGSRPVRGQCEQVLHVYAHPHGLRASCLVA